MLFQPIDQIWIGVKIGPGNGAGIVVGLRIKSLEPAEGVASGDVLGSEVASDGSVCHRCRFLFLQSHISAHAKIARMIAEMILAQRPWIVPPPLPRDGRNKFPVRSPMTADMK